MNTKLRVYMKGKDTSTKIRYKKELFISMREAEELLAHFLKLEHKHKEQLQPKEVK